MKRFFKYLCAFIMFFGFAMKTHAVEIDLVSSKTLDDYLCNGSNYCVCHRINNAGTTYKVGQLRDKTNRTVMAYCFNHALEAPYATYSNPVRYKERALTANEKKWSNAFIYILKNGWNGSSWNRSAKNGNKEFTKEEKYYVTQLAIWGLQGSSGINLDTLKPYNSCNSVQANMIKAAKSLLKDAKANNSNSPFSFKVTSKDQNMKLTSDGKYYQSGEYIVSGTGFTSFTVSFGTGSTSDTEIYNTTDKKVVKSGSTLNKGKKFVVRIAASKVTQSLNVRLDIKTTSNYNTLKTFETSTKCYTNGVQTKCQDMGLFFPVSKTEKVLAYAKLNAVGGFEVEKVDPNGKLLGGAVLAVKDSKGKVVAKWNTSKQNPRKFTNLPIGSTYTVYEITAPAKYKPIGTTTVVKIKLGKVQKIRIRNFTKNPIIISKKDLTNKTEVEGAKLEIRNALTNKVVESWTSKNEPHYVTNLPQGSYKLIEVEAPKGYIKAKAPIEFKVNANGDLQSLIYKNNTITFYNEPYEHVKISKQDATTGKELPGATLVLKDSKGNQVDKWVSGNTPHIVNKELSAGTYTLSETIAPKGYIRTTETVTFTVNAKGGVDKPVVMKNQPKQPIYISKQDATTGKELPGATLVLKDSLGTVVETWVSTTTPHLVSKVLEAGTYTLSETIAPKGYQATTKTVTFTVNEKGTVDKPVVMENKPKTPVKISKQDLTSHKELPGATLVVKDSKGKVVDKWVSKSKPHYLPALPDGEYTLTETIAPKGYIKSEETIKFTIKNGGAEQTVVMNNEKIPVTADLPLSKIIVGLSFTIVAGAAVFYKIGRQNLNAE